MDPLLLQTAVNPFGFGGPAAGMYPGLGLGSLASGRCASCAGMDAFGMQPMGFGSPDMASMQLMSQLIGILTMLMGNQGGLGGANAANAFGGGGGSPIGGLNSGGGGSPIGGGSAANTSPIGGGGAASGSNAVELGRKFLGRNAIDIKGQLPHFTAAGGQTNNCADFVSSLLESSGGLKGHFVNVKGLEQALKQQGWRQIPAAQAKPGDVWMNHSRGHVELVTAAGGTRTIGSNNDRPGHQVISERAKNPSSGVYYTRG